MNSKKQLLLIWLSWFWMDKKIFVWLIGRLSVERKVVVPSEAFYLTSEVGKQNSSLNLLEYRTNIHNSLGKFNSNRNLTNFVCHYCTGRTWSILSQGQHYSADLPKDFYGLRLVLYWGIWLLWISWGHVVFKNIQYL